MFLTKRPIFFICQSEMESRLTTLESWQKTVNDDIKSVRGLITALENNDYVTGVVPVMEGDTEIGYTLTFTKGWKLIIWLKLEMF